MANTAPIYSQANEERAQAESADWARFSSPRDTSEFCASWLAILCSQIDRVSGALLVLGPDQDGGYSAAAVWPDASRNMKYLSSAAEKALKERRGIVERVFKERRKVAERVMHERRGIVQAMEPGHQSAYVGYPIEVSGVLHGAVILDIAHTPERELQRALRLLHWASAWLVAQFRQQSLEVQETRLARISLVSDLVATAVQERHFGSAALAVVNELAARLQCDRVSAGFEKSGTIEVQAISHTAKFDRKTDLVRRISDAMEEVLDLDVAIVYPPQDNDELGVIAHNELATEVKDTAICSAPLVEGGHVIGVLTLERTDGAPFSAAEIELCKTAGLMLGPILWLKLENERSEWQRLREAFSGGTRILFGPRHPGAKLIALVIASAIVFFSLVTSEYRVASKTVIEGSVQRAAVAPYDGYIAESLVRAGDTVKKGQVLCRLDDRDLKLERVRWASEREQSERRYRQALAAKDRAAMAMVHAQIDQAQAQLSLADDKLARATLTAPFDGIVVSGDLSQFLDTPVEQGKVLFEIAPLDTYRVILNVDERDISEIEVGQQGDLALSGIPYEVMRFSVKQVTPVSTSQDGSNYFRVEAQINGPSDRLRPGMEGIGKVSVGKRKLIWIWTHGLVDWLRLWTWEWMP
jgi:RND family efflux transporter MFP subunit